MSEVSERLAAVALGELVDIAARAINDEGGTPGSSLHSWRCEHPDMYGDCDCVHETAAEVIGRLTPRLEQMLAEARAEALREAAEAVQGAVSYGFEMRPDGSEDPTAAIYVEGLRDAWQIVKDRADAAEREAR